MNNLILSVLLTPDIGLMVWSFVLFFLLLFILRKFAWKPILSAVKNREETIENSLKAAQEAKNEMESLTAKNEELLQQAKIERDKLLKEAKEKRDEIVDKAKDQANDEAKKLIESARISIQKEKEISFQKLKKEVVGIALTAAEKIIRKELKSQSSQEELVEEYLKEVKLN